LADARTQAPRPRSAVEPRFGSLISIRSEADELQSLVAFDHRA